jgi:lysophospholipase L1-like esterase
MLQNLNLGAAPNDKTGTPAREAGNIINNNFAYLESSIEAKLVDSTIINEVTTSSAIPSTGNIHAIGVGPGTYTNWGGMIVPANNIGTLQRVGSTYSVSLTAIDLTSKVNVSDVINTLVSTETAKPLSAAQGKALNEKIVNEKNDLKSDLIYKADLKAGANIFNKDSGLVRVGYFVYETSGIETANAAFVTTGLIKIPTGATQITVNHKHKIAFYDVNKVYISGSSQTDTALTQTVPSGAVYVNCTVSDWFWAYDIFMVSTGTSTPVDYVGYIPFLPKSLMEKSFADEVDASAAFIASNEVFINDLKANITDKADLVVGLNIFNKDSGLVRVGYYVRADNGVETASGSFVCTGLIKIPAGATQITMNYKHQIAFYDVNKAYISGSDNFDSNLTQSVPVGAVYVNCSVVDWFWAYDIFMVSTGTSTPVDYVAYSKTLNPGQMPLLNFNNKKWASFGDSITEANLYQSGVMNRVSGLTHYNRGIGGTTAINIVGDVVWVDANSQFLARPPALQPVGSTEISSSGCTQQRVDTIPLDADIVTIFFGANDFFNIGLLGTLAGETSTNVFYGAYQTMIKKIQTRVPDAEIILITMPYRTNEHTIVQDGSYYEDYRQAVRNIGAKFKYRVIEMNKSGINKLNYSTYLADAVHPNALGYERMSRVVLEEFKSIF